MPSLSSIFLDIKFDPPLHWSVLKLGLPFVVPHLIRYVSMGLCVTLVYCYVQKKRIVFVNFFTFPGNLSTIRPNYFDSPFSRGLWFPPFDCNKSLYHDITFVCINNYVDEVPGQGLILNICGHVMCYYWNCWGHMIYFFLRYHKHFTWCHPWRSSRFNFFLCLHRKFTWSQPWSWSKFIFCVCSLEAGDWCWCCIVGYWYVIGARTWYD